MIGLDGDGWQVRACLGDEWRWHVSPAKPWDAPGWLPARVPGSVIDDLWRAGEVPDPYAGRNSLALEWVPARAWIYRRWLDVPALSDGDRAVLDFDGVDHSASVFQDGEQVCEHEGGFMPFQVDVTPLVGAGGSRMLNLGAFHLTVSYTRVLLFLAGVFGILAGRIAFRQMDDKRGVPGLRDLWGSPRGRPLSVSAIATTTSPARGASGTRTSIASK